MTMDGGLLSVGTRRGFREDGLVLVLTTGRPFFMILMERDEKSGFGTYLIKRRRKKQSKRNRFSIRSIN